MPGKLHFIYILVSTTTREKVPLQCCICISIACSFEVKNPEIPQNNLFSIETLIALKTFKLKRLQPQNFCIDVVDK